MLGFQIERGCKCILPVLTQIGVILGLGFLVKQRSDYGLDDEPKSHLFLVHFSVLFLAIFE